MAILMVFIHHALHVKLLWMGVDLFFILSGFLITGVLLNAKQQKLGSYFARFYARRSRRILIPYVLTLALVSLIFGVSWLQHWYFYILLTNFLLPLHIPHPAALEPLWSLAVEEQFYLVWPFAVYFLSERRLVSLSVFLAVLAPCLRGALHFQQHWPIYTLTPFRMDLLAVGALLCLVYRDSQTQVELWGLKAGLICTSVGLCGLVILARLGVTTYGNSRLGNVLVYECALLCCTGLMLWALGGKAVGILCWKPLMYIGTISYTMYLVHIGILALIGSHRSSLSTAGIGLILTITYASISWFLIEKPLLHRVRRSRELAVTLQN
jgi:peptidoglycan/LPS O-acetylase OafA/YrhL